MPTGAELPAYRSAGGGIAMEFPAGNADPKAPPTRLRQRLLNVDCKSHVTVEEIETKLREADLRREKYYEKLSSKAHAFLKSPSRCSSQEEDHGHRLEAKMRSAEQKRLVILGMSQMRLARLDESRKAAKTGLEMHYKNERVKLETKVESRVQQAEANRTLMLKARRQRSAILRERSFQSLKGSMDRESKYKDCVRAAIHQKRVAAERKRLEFLEAGKKRAHALANSVSYAGEIERMKIENWDSLPRKPAELLSIKLARYWREFLREKRTTFELAKAYDTLGINKKSVKSMPFEQLALLGESPSTHQTLKALLDRIESRLKASREVAPASHLSSLDNIDHLLKRVASQKKRPSPASFVRSWEAKKVVSVRGSCLSRYPPRVVFCAYMILGHPDAVFSRKGEHEIALARCAQDFIKIFELMIKVILDGTIGPIQCSDQESGSAVIKSCTFRSQLVAFDKAWYTYLNCFVVWKVKDAQSLEEDLVRAACQLEASMIRTCKLTAEGDSDQLSDDLKAIQHKVIKDQRLLREKVQQLSGDAGIERMECALSETRSKYYRVKQSGSPSTSVSILLNPTNVSPLSTVSSSSERNISDDSSQSTSNVVLPSLFKETNTQFSSGSSSSGPKTSSDSLMASSSEKLVTENEVLVNEFLHEHQRSFSDGFGVSDHIQDGVEQKIKQTMEKAFWDVILESVKQNQPNYDLIVQLMGEVRDEICDMAPQSWKEDIFAAIDLKILSQVLISGNLDVDYLGKILEFSLVTLQKLSAPATEETMKASHQKLFSQLSEMCQSEDESNNSCVMTLVKGLQFVLEQIQTLKKDISKAHIRLIEPLVKGPASLDYLRNAFANRYGSPSNANVSLPSTLRCLSSVMNHKDQEWEEHISFSSALANNDSSSQDWLPSTTLRTGGNIPLNITGSRMASSTDGGNASGNQQPECKGEQVDLVVRLSLLKLVTGISGLTKEDLPETLFLNFSRLRSIQAQIQKIIVICTSILICRQIHLSENAVASPVDKEMVVSKCAEQLIELLDRVKDADTNDIVEVICNVSAIGDEVMDTEKLQSRKIVIARMLGKSLQAGDAVFERVFNAVYSALRGVVLGGSGDIGKKIAEMALRKVGAAVLTEMVVRGAEILIVAATISVSVHGPWYDYLIDNI
ncbi:unnamed protein product [Lupinus luteus]|uniref:T-complex protein 11 n=1 Tax=Lupinus luteus TaxID=3873 RepID=A0AAV1XU44_LUPLU